MVLDVRRLASVSVIRVLFILIGLAVGTPEGLVARGSPQQQSTPQGVIVGTVSERGSLQQTYALTATPFRR